MAGIPAVYNLQMDPGEQHDMVFNDAAPRTAVSGSHRVVIQEPTMAERDDDPGHTA
jgi:hypothetical protein